MSSRPEFKMDAEEFVRQIYQGLLLREADSAGLKHYLEMIESSHVSVADVLKKFALSEEFRYRLTVRSIADHLANELSAAISDGNLNDGQRAALSQHIAETGRIGDVIKKLLADARILPSGLPHVPEHAFIKSRYVFLHIHKTAGTSMHNMLRDAFGEGAVYSEHADSLIHRSPAQLAQFDVLAGHFNHDSFRFLPFDDIKLFTFVRDPKKRLISLYTFYRAHEPEASTYSEAMRVANQCDAEAYFCDERICHSSIAWNHMTWCIMGQSQWASWKELLAANASETERREHLSSMRRAIRKRLREFSFVGLQEDFESACAILFSVVLGRRLPPVRHELSVSRLHDQYSFMKRVETPSLTKSLDSVLTRLIELDSIVYEEASKLYKLQLSKYKNSHSRDSTDMNFLQN